MTARLFSLAFLSVLPLFMVACSKCGEDVYLTGPDLPADQAAAVYAAQGGDIPFEDIKVGAGGIAQPGRMFSFQVDAHDEKGKILGSGRLLFSIRHFPRNNGDTEWIPAKSPPSSLAGSEECGKEESDASHCRDSTLVIPTPSPTWSTPRDVQWLTYPTIALQF